MTTVIAVVGAVEDQLVREWVAHYQKLGAERFLIGVHFGPGADAESAERTLDTLGECVPGGAAHVSRGPWLAETNGDIRDALRQRAGDGWHVVADVDEFQQYPGPLPEVLAEYDRLGEVAVEGLLFDRVTASGELTGWDAAAGLDAGYPLGGFFGSSVLRSDTRKVMAARAEVPLGAGNHWAPGLRVGPSAVPPLPVHHFKWRADCRRYIEQRRAAFEGSTVPAEVLMREECGRVVDHLDANDGRLDVSGTVEYTVTTLDTMPTGWSERIVAVMDYWWRQRWLDTRSTGT
jgi:hypothetical protein